MKTNKLWADIFKKYNILEEIEKNGQFCITAEQLKEFGEPRLLTYFDEQSNLPDVFRDNGLSILPISRKEYIIGAFELYLPLDYKIEDIRDMPLTELETLDHRYLNNEYSAILFAFNTEILHDAFEIDELFFTMSGRMGTQPFSFNINTKNSEFKALKVDKAQIEIDAGFESSDEIFIIEAKNRFVDDINLRQLYYPFKLWSGRVSKTVTPVFMVYSDSAFHIFICTFRDPANMNSLEIMNTKKYVLASDEPITTEAVEHLLETIEPTTNESCQFPQADSFEKIIDLLNYARSNSAVSNKDVAEHFHFDPRQSAYYSSAAKFLGLMNTKKGGGYSLSDKGNAILSMPYNRRHLELIKIILSDAAFNEVFKKTIAAGGEIPSKQDIVSILRKHYFSKSSNAQTAIRRSGTVSGWIKWILRTIE